MRKLTKKALSAAMAVLLVFTSTFAGSKGTARAEEPERAEIAVDTADALADALTNAEKAANIVLSEDITLERNEGFIIAADRNITLDLNGHELKLIAPEKSNAYLFDVYGTLTVNDSTGTGRLFLSSKESDSGTSNAYAVLINHGSLTMNSGTIECAPLGSPNRTYGISNQINGSLTMNGGSIKTPFFGTGISVSIDSETGICSTTLHGGSISGGSTGIWLESNGYKNTYATLLIDGGTFNGSNNALMVSGNNPKYFRVTICDRVNTDDGSVISTPVFMNNVMFGNTTNPDNIIVSGGDFYGLSGCYSLVKGSKFISGGNYYNDTSQNSSNYLLPNKYVYTNGNGYSVRDESFFPVYVDVTYSLNNEKQNKRYVFDAIAKALDFCRNIDKSEGHDITDYQIILNKDCVTDEQLIVPAGKAYTLNLNGKVLSSTGAGYQSVLLVENGGALVINDTTGGRITTGSAAQYAAVILTSKDNYDETATATLTVNGGILVGRYYAIVGNGNRHNTNITINGGTITATEANDNTAIYHPQNGTLTVNGGTITGATGIYMKSGKLSITGGTITGNGTAVDYKPTGDGAQITGDALVIDNCGYPGGAPVPSVTGGTFVSTNASPIASYTDAKTDSVIGGFVEAGSFNKEIARALCITGMACYPNGGGTYGIMPIRYVAEVDGERYEAFADAVTNASDKTIKLLADVNYTMSSLTEVLTIDKNEHSVSIVNPYIGYKLSELVADDLSVYTLVQDPTSDYWVFKLTKDGKDTYYENASAAFAAAKELGSCALTLLKDCTTTTQLVVPNGLTLTLNLNGKELVSSGAGYQSVLLVENGGSLTINDTDGGRIVSGTENQYAAVILTAKATYNENLTASLTVNGGTLVGYYYAIVGNGNRHNTDITINGGSITALAENDNVGIYHPQNGTLTINGGTITGATGIYMKSGTLTINGGTITGNGAAAEYVTMKDGLQVTGDALVIDNCGYPGGAPVPSVTGGTFISVNASPIASYTSEATGKVLDGFVSDGTFNKEIARFLCEKDLTSTPDGNGMYIIAPIPYVAIVNGVYYEFFEDAAAASKKTAVITLLSDIDAYALTSSSAKLLIKKNGFHINITCTAANYMLSEATDEDGITTFSCVQDPSSDYWCVYIAFADGSVKYYNSITTASSGVKNGCTLYLMKDVVTTNRTTFGNFSTKNGDITIDLNGHTLTFDHSAGKSNYAPIYITYNNHITIRNGNIIVINDEAISVKEGSVTLAEDLTISSDKAAVVVWGTSSVTTSATITAGDSFAIAANGSAGQAADITILGGNIKSDTIAIYQPSAGSLTIKGGTITGSTPVYVKSGKLTMTGGVLHATGEKSPYQFYGNGAYTTGDALVIDNCGYPGGAPVPSVTGGTFISDNASPIASYTNEATDKVLGGFVSGGTFNKELERFLCAKDLTSTPDGEGMYIIAPIPYVASINGVRYEFLSDAVAAVPADGTETTIVLLRDAVGNGITTNAGQNIVIDFNGFTYNVDKTVGSAGTETNGFQLLKGSKVTLKNGTLTSNTAKILIQNYSELTVLDMNLDGTKSPACGYVISNNNGSCDILGNTDITAAPGKKAFDVCVTTNYPDGVVVTIDTTGTITGAIEYDVWDAVPAENKTGLNIKNGTFDITWAVEAALTEAAKDHFEISGGKFAVDVPTAYLTEGLATSFNKASGYYELTKALVKIGDTTYASLPEAVAAVPDDGTETTIVLLEDIVGQGIVTKAGQNIVIDFNGFTYNVDKTVGSKGTETNGFQLLKGSKVTLKNGTLTSNTASILIQNYSELTVLDMNLDGTNYRYCGYVISNNNGSLDVLGDTNITAAPGKKAFDVCVTNRYPDGVVVTIDTTGTITGIIEYDVWGTKPTENKTGLNIVNGTFDITWAVEAALTEDAKTNFEISGGKFSVDVPSAYLAEGLATTLNKTNGYYELTKAVAKIGETTYASLPEAVAAVPKDGTETTVVLLEDIVGQGIVTNAGQNVVIDFNGFTYNVDKTVGSKGTETNGFQLLKDSKVTLKNGTLTSNTASILIQNYSELTVLDMNLDGTKSSACNYVVSNNNGSLDVLGDTSITAAPGKVAFDVCVTSNYPDGVVVTIDTTGTVTGAIEYDLWGTKPAVNKTGLIIKNGTFDITWAVEDALTEEAKESFEISGGKFTTDVPNEYLAEGLATKYNKTSKYFELVTAVAAIKDRTFASLTEAIAAVPTDGTETTVVLLTDAVGNGITTNAGQNIVIDFNGFTYNVDKTVGSAGTETNGFQLLKGSKVTLKNGTLTSNTAKILIQNYSELTVLDMNLDGTKSDCSYVVSNNNGSFDVLGNTSITAAPGKVAFDVCVTSNYPDGVVVTIDTTGTVTGAIEYDLWGTKPAVNKTGLIIKNGTFDITWAVEDALTEEAKENFVVSGGKFTTMVPADYIVDFFIAEEQDDYFAVVPDRVAQIGDKTYSSLTDAIAAVPADGTLTTITLLKDFVGQGIITNAGQNVVIDFNGFTYNVDKTVGSAGTETNGFQLLKGSKVTIKNGTLTSNTAKILIQNYSELTVLDMNLDGTKSDCSYVISNNNGSLDVLGDTSITASPGKVAFDVCVTSNYPDGVVVTIDTTGTVTGAIEYDLWGTKPAVNKTGLIIKNGTFDITWAVEEVLTEEAKESFEISGGKFSVDVPNEYLAEGLATTLNTSSTYFELVPAVAMVDGITYASFADAASAAGNKKVITLLSDIDSHTFTSSSAKLLIKKNGHSINITCSVVNYMLSEVTDEDGITTFSCVQDPTSPNWEAKLVLANGTTTYYTSFVDACTNVKSNSSIYLLKDVTTTRRCSIGTALYCRNSNVTIDLGGHTVTYDHTTSASSAYNCFYIRFNNTVTIKNGTMIAIGDDLIKVAEGILILQEDVTLISEHCAVGVLGSSSVITSADITAGDSFAIAANGSAGQNAHITVLGGNIKSDEIAIYQPSAGSLAISGGTITGTTPVYVKSGMLSITGGTLHATGEKKPYQFYGNGAYTTGDALVIDNCGYPGGTPVPSVTGGTFISDNASPIASYTNEATDKVLGGFVSGGTFNKEIARFLCAKDLTSTPDGEGMYIIAPIPYVASINGVRYEFLSDAVAAVPADGTETTIVLLRDAVGNGITTNAGQNIVIDFNGFTYNVDKTVGSAGTETNGFQLLKGSKVTLKNGTLTSNTAKILIQNYSELTVLDMNLDGTKSSACNYVVSNNNGSFDVLGDTSITAAPGKVAFDVCVTSNYPDGVVVTIDTTGTVTGAIEYDLWGTKPAENKTGLNIKNGTFDITWAVEAALTEAAKEHFEISGGKFSVDVPTAYLTEGLATSFNKESGYYELTKALVKIGDTTYASLPEAVAAVPDDGTETTIILLEDIVGQGIVTKAGQNIVIDFNGFTYNVDKTVGSKGTETNGFQLLKGSKVTLKNGTLTSNTAKILIQNYSELTVLDMNLDGTKSSACSYVVSNNNGSFDVLGDTSITAAPGKKAFDVCVTTNYPDGVVVTIDTTGTITGAIEYDVWDAVPAENKTGLNIKNGTFDITWAVEAALTEAAKEHFEISGGKFSVDVPSAYLADGLATTVNKTNGYYELTKAVVKIGETTYASLPEAIEAVPTNGTETTVVLLESIVGQGIVTNAGQNVVIDFNGFTYNVDKTVGSKGTETNGFQLLKGSKVTLKNGTLTSNTASILIQNYSELTVLDMNLDGTKSSACNYVVSNNNGSLDVLGDTSITAAPGKVAFDVCVTSNYPDGVVVTIDTTGTVTGAIEYDLWGTKPSENKTGLIIKNGTFDITWAVEDALTEEAKENFVVSGGKFSVDVPNEYLAEGLATKLNKSSKYYELVTAVAAIKDRTFASLTEAIVAVPTDGTETTVVLLTDSVGNGIKVLEGQNLILDFNTHSYNIDKTAEVSAAELTGFRLYENAKVTLKNGTLSTTSIFVADLIQNYADLTLIDMTLDGSKSPKLGYVISNITGRCDVLGNTSILAKKGKIAFDLCASSYYPAGVIINIDTTGTITGSIDYELWDSLTESNPTALTIKNGTFDIVWNVSDELTTDAAERFTVYGGRFTKDVPAEYLAPGHTTSFEDGYYVISPITDMITLTLGGAIGVNFYLNLDALKEIPSRIVIDEISFSSEEIAAAKVTEGAAEGFYLFTLPKYAKQMTDEIVCTMYDSEGNVMRTKSTSVKEIGEQYLTVYAEDEALTTLIKAMLHYGSMSQSYFDYNEDASAIDGIDVSELVIPEADVFNDHALTIDGESTEMAFFGHSLLLNSKVTLRYYFMPMVDNLSEVIFTIDGTMVTPVVMSNGLCYIELADIPAQELLTAHVASVGELSIAASAYSYAAGFFTQYERDPELEALLLAMYIYCQAAQAYMQ